MLQVGVHDRQVTRPMRRMQRTRLSASPIERAVAALPSGELSSTNITSQSWPARTRLSRATRIGMLASSLKVGTTIVSSGAGRTTAPLSGRGSAAAGLAGDPPFIVGCDKSPRSMPPALLLCA
jgi:hypothetical protein